MLVLQANTHLYIMIYMPYADDDYITQRLVQVYTARAASAIATT